LNDFKGADRLGLATGQPLHLVQEDPFHPSFLMYHYKTPEIDEKNNPPLSDLAEKIWKYEGTSEADSTGAREIRFSTTAPPPFGHLTTPKIYRLAPRDYNIGLTLEFKVAGGKELPHPFRYQLAGAHGLPIEGVWYTNTFRNSMIGMLDSRKNLQRTVEEARQISFHEGGERVPESQRSNDSLLQYAG